MSTAEFQTEAAVAPRAGAGIEIMTERVEIQNRGRELKLATNNFSGGNIKGRPPRGGEN